jgi:HAD superfamily hydrolase (TIGR01509 family)
MISAVIFDLDGLLTDTEKLHFAAYVDVFSEYGIAITETEYNDLWTRQGLGINAFVERHDLPHDPDELRNKKIERYIQLLETSLEPMPGAIKLVKRMVEHKRLAVASSSYKGSIDVSLRVLEISEYFSVITHVASTSRPKPYPDQLFLTARMLGAEPHECVVLEDAEKGIVAAHRAGMKSIAVPNRHTADNDFSKATLVVKSLDEVTVELIDSL